MWTSIRASCSTRYTSLLSIIVFTAYIHPAVSIPHALSARQTTYEALQLPSCALSCLLSSVLTDGCANEADFSCHCSAGDIIGEAKACIRQGCDQKDEVDAFKKLQTACRIVRGGTGGNGDSISTSPSSGLPSSTPSISTTSSAPPTPTQSPMNAPGIPNPQPTPLPSSTLPPSDNGNGAPTSPPPMPTDTPLALLPPSDQLSDGAKAGISVSVSFLALSIFLALGWYIRRLKRELKAVQRAAAGIPPDIWHASIATATAPAPGSLDRQASSGRGRRLSRHGSLGSAGRESPVSPLSPRAMEEVLTITDNGYGVLKKKRGHVLSVVVEREEEESRSGSMDRRSLGSRSLDTRAWDARSGDARSMDAGSLDRMVRQPVPGQREGLSGPLELDGGFRGLAELPGVVTPRERSVER